MRCPDLTDKQAIDHKVIFCNFDVTAGYEFTRDIKFISGSTPAPGVGRGAPASTIVEAQAAYAYSPTHGRIAQIAKSPNQTFSHAYTLNSNLLATVSGPIHTVTNNWEPDHDHLDLKQNKVGSSVISGYDCAVNAIGQRTGVATSNRAYQYDAIGNRQKTANSLTLPAANNHTANPLNQYTTIQQGDTSVSPVLTKTRLWGTDLSGSMQRAGGVRGMLSESSPITSNPITFNSSYSTCDGKGNVIEYLDSNGQITTYYEYDSLGNIVVNTDTSNQFSYRFSTKPIALATGLYNYGYRYYDPITGCWPSRDPIEEKGGVNSYGFVGNHGIEGIDVLGKFHPAGWAVIGAISAVLSEATNYMLRECQSIKCKEPCLNCCNTWEGWGRVIIVRYSVSCAVGCASCLLRPAPLNGICFAGCGAAILAYNIYANINLGNTAKTCRMDVARSHLSMNKCNYE